ncbi:MAG: fructose-1,6-bisphosphatase/inositol monophosphatase family enzyme [Gammaproteobacteria bacterium]|jgi:fructose-1,6-bisphosphatase/inositol monophosphatase family enzyme
MAGDPRKGLEKDRCAELLQCAQDLADVLREAITETVGQGLTVAAKADQSVVTNADTAAEQAFRSAVISHYPVHGVRGEELPPLNPDAEFVWVVDPIDGTAEFAAGMPLWGTIIGLYYRDRPLVGVIDLPVLNLRACAAFGLGATINGESVSIEALSDDAINGRERVGTPSRVNYAKHEDGGAFFDKLCAVHPNIRVAHTCFTHVMTLSGALDAAIEWNAPLWDVAATRILIEEAGGKYMQLKAPKGQAIGDDGKPLHNVVFGRPGLVERIAATLSA